MKWFNICRQKKVRVKVLQKEEDRNYCTESALLNDLIYNFSFHFYKVMSLPETEKLILLLFLIL